MKKLTLVLLILLSAFAFSEEAIHRVSPASCEHGVRLQPENLFGLYVFCDDARGTNISVFLNRLGAPLAGSYELNKRFWQDELWGLDVTSFAWLKENRLLVATSGIYGTGSVYLLDLIKQEYKVLLSDVGAIIELEQIEAEAIKVKVYIDPEEYEFQWIKM